MSSPTSRTIDRCRDLGWTAQVVERWNPHARIRQDLFGVIDVVALVVHEAPSVTDPGCLGIQACAGASAAARIDKAIAEPRLRIWLWCGNRFEVWAWAKRGARGKRKVWTVRRVAVRLESGELKTEEMQ